MKSKNKIPKTFIGFLIASLLIWFLITLSKEYVIPIRFSLEYNQIPQNKILQTVPSRELELLIKASGFKILKTRIVSKKITINAGFAIQKKGTKYYILSKNQRSNIQKQMPKGLALQEITKDTLFLDLGSLVSKKIPINPILNIQYHVGYDLSEPIEITPDSLTVFGPENYIVTLDKIDLKPVKLEGVKENFTINAAVQVPKDVKNLKFSASNASIKGRVENFTEGSIEVPYKMINIPEGIRIKTLSKNVSISFIVGLNHFNTIQSSSFQVVCDYQTAVQNNVNYFVPKLIHKPTVIKSFKILPNKIDFLIEK